jgi:hypothetical protein
MTRTCPDLVAFLAGTLDRSEAASAREHLAGCPTCRDETRRWVTVGEAARSAFREWQPPLRLARRPQTARPAARGYFLAGAAACVLPLLMAIMVPARHDSALTVEPVAGRTALRRSGSGAPATVSGSHFLREGDHVQVEPGARALLRLPGSGTLSVLGPAELEGLRSGGSETRIKVRHGSVDAARDGGQGRLVLETEGGSVSTGEGRFVLRHYAGTADGPPIAVVRVLSGTVAARVPGGEVAAGVGERLLLSRGRAPSRMAAEDRKSRSTGGGEMPATATVVLGEVRSGDGLPAARAQVQVAWEAGGGYWTTRCDETGCFLLTELPSALPLELRVMGTAGSCQAPLLLHSGEVRRLRLRAEGKGAPGNEPVALTGRILSETGGALDCLDLRIEACTAAGERRPGRCDAATGRFRIPLVPGTRCRIAVTAGGFTAEGGDFEAGGTEAEFRVPAAAVARDSGTLRVVLAEGLGPVRWVLGFSDGSTLTGAAAGGETVLAGLRPGRAWIGAASAQGAVAEQTVELQAGASLDWTPAWEARRPVRVRVLDGSGAPAPGSRIELFSGAGTPLRDLVGAPGVTDAQGVAELLAPAGALGLRVRLGGEGEWTLAGAVAPGAAGADVGGVAFGRVFWNARKDVLRLRVLPEGGAFPLLEAEGPAGVRAGGARVPAGRYRVELLTPRGAKTEELTLRPGEERDLGQG